MLKVGGAQSVSLSDTNYCGLYQLVWAGLVLTSLNMESSTNFGQPFLFFVPFQVGWWGFASLSNCPFSCLSQNYATDCRWLPCVLCSFLPRSSWAHHHHHTTVTDKECMCMYADIFFPSATNPRLHHQTEVCRKPNIIETCENPPHASISFSSVFAPAAWEENEPAGKNNPNKAQFRRNHCLLIFPSQLRQQWQLNQSHFSRQVGHAPNIGPSAIVALLWMKRNLISVKKS